jgi:DNA ligase (NAD+)
LDNPTISDKEYDKLYDELIQLERETKTILPNSPTQKVGGQILEGFKKVEHKNKLWSLDKRQSFDGVKEWLTWCENFVKDYNRTHTTKLPQLQYLVLKKFDGLTVKCEYEDINYTQGSSRGTGSIGEDFSEQVKSIINLPLQLKDNSKQTSFLSVHGEALMTKKAFKEYNKTAKIPLKTLRNGVAGALRNLDVSETAKRKPIIYFYNINDIEGVEFQTYEQQLDYIKYRGLPVAKYVVCNTYEEIIESINNIEIERPNLSYDIDGAVIAINDLMTRQAMGYTIKFPRFSLAYKYEAEQTTTKILDVEWSTSRTGRINPVAILEPVDLMGVTVKRATLNNLDDMKKKGVKINAEVPIRRSNDVIPEITGVIEESLNNEDIKDIEIPTECPTCHHKTEIRKDAKTNYLYCTNSSCKAQLSKSITHYTSREAMNIIGFSEKTIEKLIKLDIIKSIADIYELNKEENKELILKQDGFQLTSYNKLINSIEKSKICKLEQFIYALGIENCGKSTAKNLVEFVKGNTALDKINEILDLQVCDLMRMKDTGNVVASSIYKWFSDIKNREMLSYLSQMELTLVEDKSKEIIQGVFSGKSIYCSGSFAYGKKNELKALVENNGGIFANGLNKSLDYLVIGSIKGSSKEQKAKELGVTVLQEDEFLQIIKGNCI